MKNDDDDDDNNNNSYSNHKWYIVKASCETSSCSYHVVIKVFSVFLDFWNKTNVLNIDFIKSARTSSVGPTF